MRAQCGGAGFSGLDSMNLWIEIAKDSLLAAIAEVDCLVVNDAEIRMLTGESNLARAARAVMAMGPRAVVAKQGEYGAALFTGPDGDDSFFALPGFPLEDVRDPTGAGDSFAGGFFGYLDGSTAISTRRTCGGRWATAPCSPPSTSRSSAPSGSPASSREEIDERFEALRRMTQFEGVPAPRD